MNSGIPDIFRPLSKYLISTETAVGQRNLKNQSPTSPSYFVGFPYKHSSIESGKVAIQFPPGFPMLLAGGYKLFGVAGLILTPWLLLANAAVFAGLIARSFWGTSAGLGAFLLTLFNPLLTWNANHLYAEIALLVFWLMLLYCACSNRRPSLPRDLAMASLAAALLLIKIDSLLLLILPFALLVVPSGTRKPKLSPRFYLLLTLFVGTALFTVYSSAPLYYETTLRSLNLKAIVAALLILSALGPLARNIKTKSTSLSKLLPYIILTLLTATLVYLWILRPSWVTDADSFYFPPKQDYIQSWREHSLQRLSTVLNPLFQFTAILGILFLIPRWRKLTTPLKSLMIIGILSLLLVSWDIRCNPILPYSLRRYIPFAIPVLIFGFLYFTHRAGLIWRGKAQIIQTLMLAAAILTQFFLSKRLSHYQEYPSLYRQLEHIDAGIESEPVFIVQPSPLSPLAPFLRFGFDNDVWVLTSEKKDPELNKALRQALHQQELLFLSTTPHPPIRAAKTEILLKDTVTLIYPAVSNSEFLYETIEKDIPYFLLKVSPAR